MPSSSATTTVSSNRAIFDQLATRYQLFVSLLSSVILFHLIAPQTCLSRIIITLFPLVLSIIVNIAYGHYAYKKVVNPNKCSILITGCSSGIGKACVEEAIKQGFLVFACVRKESDADNLKNKDIPNAGNLLHVLLLDVTDEESVKRSISIIKNESEKQGRVFMGLVNNAGIAATGPVEIFPLDAAKKMFDVNLFGVVTMIQQLLPLLREGASRTAHKDARIVNISSMAGIISGLPSGLYSASKHSVQCITDSVRNENYKYGIKAVTVNPGLVKTQFTSSAMESYVNRILNDTDPGVLNLYGKVVNDWKKRKADMEQGKHPMENGIPPSDVAQLVMECLTVARPDEINPIGKEKAQLSLITTVPQWLSDILVRKVSPAN